MTTIFFLAPSWNDRDIEEKIAWLTSMGFTKVGRMFEFLYSDSNSYQITHDLKKLEKTNCSLSYFSISSPSDMQLQ